METDKPARRQTAELALRLARPADAAALTGLIEASVRRLQVGDHTPAQINGALGRVFGVDRQLIDDGTYFVVEDGAELVACGGWSWRRTLFGADAVRGRDDAPLRPGAEPARIRAFFVAPAWARRGLASRLLEVCETAAAAQGFTTLELGATLTGEPFYTRRGYVVRERLDAPLPGGPSLPIIRMGKALGPASEGPLR